MSAFALRSPTALPFRSSRAFALSKRRMQFALGVWRRAYSGAKSQTLAVRPLAYDLHEPSTPRADKTSSPILFLHGLFGSKKNNRGISKALARDLGRYVYALDLRNHGDSPHNKQHDYPAMTEDVAAFIQDHALKNTTIIGHSMGAKTAMTLALQAPDSLNSIVAVDNAPVEFALGNTFAEYIRGMTEIEGAGLRRQSEADRILGRYEKSLLIRQFLLGNLVRPSGSETYKFRIPLSILARSLDNLGSFPYKHPDGQRFEKPALFVRGTKSDYVSDNALSAVKGLFPQFRLVDIDAGHWLISEQPEAFRQVVVDFLKS